MADRIVQLAANSNFQTSKGISGKIIVTEIKMTY